MLARRSGLGFSTGASCDDSAPHLARQLRGSGTPRTGTPSAGSAITNASGEAWVELTVTMQPGDNFRVAASCDESYLNACEVTNTTTVRHPVGGDLPRIKAKITEMLTVWRKLHVEVDSMGPVVGNTVTGDVTAVEYQGGTSTVTTDQNLDDSVDRFEGGSLTNGGHSFTVVSNTNGDNFQVTVSNLPGQPPVAPVEGAFSLVDDDAEAMPHQPNTGWVESRFKPAYVTPVLDGGGDPGNNSNNVEFDLNVDDLESDLQVNKGMQCLNTNDFWASYLQGAFQGRQAADGDPDSGPNGEGFQVGRTPTSFGSSSLRKPFGIARWRKALIEMNWKRKPSCTSWAISLNVSTPTAA